MDWLAFLGSIIGGLIGGLFTFFGVKLTIKHEKEKDIKEERQKINDTKPRLEIIKYLDFEQTKNSKEICDDCNVLALHIDKFEISSQARFYYNNDALDDKNLIFVEYELKNTGLTEIEDICITSNLPKNMSLVYLKTRDFYINENLLNYDVWANKRYIKPGQSINIRVYFINEHIIYSNLGNPILTVWLKDVNGRFWSQALDCPNNEIYNSINFKYIDFKNNIDIDTAIQCFRDPFLW